MALHVRESPQRLWREAAVRGWEEEVTASGFAASVCTCRENNIFREEMTFCFETDRERERERERVGKGKREGGREREREGEREDRERIPSRLQAVSPEPDMGFHPMNHEIMTWTESKSWTLNPLSHDAPRVDFQSTSI